MIRFFSRTLSIFIAGQVRSLIQKVRFRGHYQSFGMIRIFSRALSIYILGQVRSIIWKGQVRLFSMIQDDQILFIQYQGFPQVRLGLVIKGRESISLDSIIERILQSPHLGFKMYQIWYIWDPTLGLYIRKNTIESTSRVQNVPNLVHLGPDTWTL